VGGRAEYFLSGQNGEKWSGSWTFTAVNPISSFEAYDGEDNAEDENMPSSMTFTFDTTPTGSRLTIVTRFSSVEAMELTIPGAGAVRRVFGSGRCPNFYALRSFRS
jgi:hypothetical protein